MKKIMLVFLLLVTACSTAPKDLPEGKVVTITQEEALKKMENKEDFVLLVSAENCPGCKKLHSELETQLASVSTVVYEVVLGDMQSQDQEALRAVFEQAQENFEGFEGTPYYAYYKKGENKDYKNGYMPDDFMNWIKEHHLEEYQ